MAMNLKWTLTYPGLARDMKSTMNNWMRAGVNAKKLPRNISGMIKIKKAKVDAVARQRQQMLREKLRRRR